VALPPVPVKVTINKVGPAGYTTDSIQAGTTDINAPLVPSLAPNVLDGNLAPAAQAAWLEQKLSQSHSTWKFVLYHQPAYSSGGNRDNPEERAAWTPLFDKYHVDMALQGHDHAYLRTYPLRGGQRVTSPREGTVYVIAVSGTKAYPQPKHAYTEVGMTNVATFQVLDIQTNPNRLTYRAYDGDAKVRDEQVIEK